VPHLRGLIEFRVLILIEIGLVCSDFIVFSLYLKMSQECLSTPMPFFFGKPNRHLSFFLNWESKQSKSSLSSWGAEQSKNKTSWIKRSSYMGILHLAILTL